MMRSVRVPAITFCLSALLVSQASAQSDRWVVVREPGEWLRRQPISWQAGQQLRIQGQAFHPDTVVSVSVNGSAAEIQRDATDGRLVNFTHFLRVEESADVRIVARTARDSVSETFTVNVVIETPPPQPQPTAGGGVPAPPPEATAVPGFVPSFLIPGSGQLRTGRAPLGLVVLGAAGGVAAAGVLTTKKEIQCATRTTTCTGSAILSSTTSRPYLIPAIVAAAAISAVGAWEARKSAMANPAGTGASLPPSRFARLVRPSVTGDVSGAVGLEWQLLRF
jgi:hypothetical protein